MGDEIASLPLGRLHSMIAGSFRYGAERERLGEVGGTEMAYANSEHHARRLIKEFIEGELITVATPVAS